MAGNLIIVHGGGPTAVINASLYGAIRQAQESPEVDRVLVAIGGTGGLLKEHIKDVTDFSKAGVGIEIGRGKIDFPALIRMMREVNYTGMCSLEYEKDMKDPFLGIAESIGYFKAVSDML